MNIAVQASAFYPLLGSGLAASAVADDLSRYLLGIRADSFRTATVQLTLAESLRQLIQIYGECHESNWGGNDESPVRPNAIYEAANFLQLFTSTMQSPDIYPEPGGAIAFEWRFGTFKSLIASFAGDNAIEFACVNGRASTFFGRVPFYQAVPIEILRYLKDLSN